MSRILHLLRDPNKKSYFTILKEVLHLWYLKGEFPSHYGGKFLYRKEISNYTDYISVKEFERIHLSKKLHPVSTASILRNKLSFAMFCENVGIPTPKLIGFNMRNHLHLGGNSYEVFRAEEYSNYLDETMRSAGVEEIFMKPIGDMGGTDCILLKRETLKEQVADHFDSLMKSFYIYQNKIEQHEKINEIYGGSVNTIRFDTYIDKKGDIHLLSAFMRFGARNNFVDNGSAGGVWIGVEMETGELKDYAFRALKFGGQRFYTHPDTGFTFAGFKIPYFCEAKLLIKKATFLLPDTLIGWDVAITPEGPIIVEGNDNPSIFTSDTTFGGYLKLPIFKELLNQS